MKVVLRNAPENHKMVAPSIQKDIDQCFGETRNKWLWFCDMSINVECSKKD